MATPARGEGGEKKERKKEKEVSSLHFAGRTSERVRVYTDNINRECHLEHTVAVFCIGTRRTE